MPHPGGRPSLYTPELGAAICDLIVDGLSVREIGARAEMPEARTIWRWAASNDEFRQHYAQAMEIRADRMAEEIISIADDGTNDWMERQSDDEKAMYVLNGEHVQRSRLRVDARKWVAAKMQPHKYGDRQQIEHSGSLTLEQLVLQSYGPKE